MPYALGLKKCREGGLIPITHSSEQVSQPKLAWELVPVFGERIKMYCGGERQQRIQYKKSERQAYVHYTKNTTVITKGAGLVYDTNDKDPNE